MRDLIRKVPIPAAGVALGLAALGNLLQPHAEALHVACGVCAVFLVALLLAKIILFPLDIRKDMRNSILASVSATLFMSLMQIATYLAPFAHLPAFVLWGDAVAAHAILIVWFTARFITKFKLNEVFPTYFICYVGIVVASATAPTFGMEAFGHAVFWFGFVCYLVLLVVVTLRYLRHETPESARPLFCIYTAPMSLSIVGYLATADQPSLAFVGVMLVLAQLFFVVVLTRVPQFMRLSFYPSFAAMAFPFVITATALGQAVAFFRESGVYVHQAFDVLVTVETLIAIAMVLFVFAHYLRYLFRAPQEAAVASRRARLSAWLLNRM